MLNNIQKEVLKIIAPLRSESSHIAGSTPANIDYSRMSSDIDIFNDNMKICETSFKKDIFNLEKYGFLCKIKKTPDKYGIGEIIVSKNNDSTVIQWVCDSAWRFFPVVHDDIFGFCLDKRDLAVNKILALAGRETVRDYYDICQMMINGESIPAYIFAACGKDEGYTPELLLSAIAFATRKWKKEEFDLIKGANLNFVKCKEMMNNVIFEARESFSSIPIEYTGAMFLDLNGKPFIPQKNDEYIIHKISLYGSYPIFPQEIKPEFN